MSDGIHRLPWRARTRSNVVLGALLLMLSLLATACGAGGNGNSSQATITVAAVGNPQMLDLQKLVPEFEKAHSDIQVKFVILPENQLRQQVTQDVATHSGRFDLSMIGTYEVPLWAKTAGFRIWPPTFRRRPPTSRTTWFRAWPRRSPTTEASTRSPSTPNRRFSCIARTSSRRRE